MRRSRNMKKLHKNNWEERMYAALHHVDESEGNLTSQQNPSDGWHIVKSVPMSTLRRYWCTNEPTTLYQKVNTPKEPIYTSPNKKHLTDLKQRNRTAKLEEKKGDLPKLSPPADLPIFQTPVSKDLKRTIENIKHDHGYHLVLESNDEDEVIEVALPSKPSITIESSDKNQLTIINPDFPSKIQPNMESETVSSGERDVSASPAPSAVSPVSDSDITENIVTGNESGYTIENQVEFDYESKDLKWTIEIVEHDNIDHVRRGSSDEDEVIQVALSPKPIITTESSDENQLTIINPDSLSKNRSNMAYVTCGERDVSTSPVPSAVSPLSPVSDSDITENIVTGNESGYTMENQVKFDYDSKDLKRTIEIDEHDNRNHVQRESSDEDEVIEVALPPKSIITTESSDENQVTIINPDSLSKNRPNMAYVTCGERDVSTTPVPSTISPLSPVSDSDITENIVTGNESGYTMENQVKFDYDSKDLKRTIEIDEHDNRNHVQRESSDEDEVIEVALPPKPSITIESSDKNQLTIINPDSPSKNQPNMAYVACGERDVSTSPASAAVSLLSPVSDSDVTENIVTGIESGFTIDNQVEFDYDSNMVDNDSPHLGSTRYPKILELEPDFDFLMSKGKVCKYRFNREKFRAMFEKMYSESWGGEDFDQIFMQNNNNVPRDESLWLIDPEDREPDSLIKMITCNYYDQKGHFDDTCSMKPIVCYACGDIGHLEESCPKKICGNCRSPTKQFTMSCNNCIHKEPISCFVSGERSDPCPFLLCKYHSTIESVVTYLDYWMKRQPESPTTHETHMNKKKTTIPCGDTKLPTTKSSVNTSQSNTSMSKDEESTNQGIVERATNFIPPFSVNDDKKGNMIQDNEVYDTSDVVNCVRIDVTNDIIDKLNTDKGTLSLGGLPKTYHIDVQNDEMNSSRAPLGDYRKKVRKARRGRRRPKQRNNSFRCNYCNQQGHFDDTCSMKPIVCNACGDIGHLEASCPKKICGNIESAGTSQNYCIKRQPESPTTHETHMNKKKTTIPCEDTKLPSTKSSVNTSQSNTSMSKDEESTNQGTVERAANFIPPFSANYDKKGNMIQGNEVYFTSEDVTCVRIDVTNDIVDKLKTDEGKLSLAGISKTYNIDEKIDEMNSSQAQLRDYRKKVRKTGRGRRRPKQHNDSFRCNYCNQQGHFDDTCSMKPIVCNACGDIGHLEASCPKKICGNCGSPTKQFTMSCFNCIHWAPISCFVSGERSDPCPFLLCKYHSTIGSAGTSQDYCIKRQPESPTTHEPHMNKKKTTIGSVERAANYIPPFSANYDKKGNMIQDNRVSDTSDFVTCARIDVTNDIIDKLHTDKGKLSLGGISKTYHIDVQNDEMNSFLRSQAPLREYRKRVWHARRGRRLPKQHNYSFC